ncbi:MAG: hypothetical protein R3D59_15140 [Paracoccaceae bacterium]
MFRDRLGDVVEGFLVGAGRVQVGGAARIGGRRDDPAVAVDHVLGDPAEIARAGPADRHPVGLVAAAEHVAAEHVAADAVIGGGRAVEIIVVQRNHLRVFVGAKLGLDDRAQDIGLAGADVAEHVVAHAHRFADRAGRFHFRVPGVAAVLEGDAGIGLAPLMRQFDHDVSRIAAAAERADDRAVPGLQGPRNALPEQIDIAVDRLRPGDVEFFVLALARLDRDLAAAPGQFAAGGQDLDVLERRVVVDEEAEPVKHRQGAVILGQIAAERRQLQDAGRDPDPISLDAIVEAVESIRIDLGAQHRAVPMPTGMDALGGSGDPPGCSRSKRGCRQPGEFRLSVA